MRGQQPIGPLNPVPWRVRMAAAIRSVQPKIDFNDDGSWSTQWPVEIPKRQLGYVPTFWEDPRRVAQWHEKLRGLPAGEPVPDWIDRDQLNIAYDYLRLAHKGAPASAWRFPNAQDPIRGFLQNMPTPPEELMRPGEAKYVPPAGTDMLTLGGENRPEGQPPLPRVGTPEYAKLPLFMKLELPLFRLGEVTETLPEQWVKALADELGMTEEEATNIVTSAASGATMGATFGGMAGTLAAPGPGTLSGGLVGGLFGLGLGGGTATAQGLLARWARAQPGIVGPGGGMEGFYNFLMGATNALGMTLAWPAQIIENTIGAAAQAVYSAVDPEKYGPLSDLGIDPMATWSAGGAFYEGVPTTGLTPGGAEPGKSIWQAGLPDPVDLPPELQTSTGWEALGIGMRDARQMLMENKDMTTWDVAAWAADRFGFSSMMQDLIFQGILDPLNAVGDQGVRGVKLWGEATNNPHLVRAADIGVRLKKPGLVRTFQIYQTLLRTTVPPEQISHMGRFARYLGGVTAEGKLVDVEAPRTKLGKIFGLTPRARAVQILAVGSDGLKVLMGGRDEAVTFPMAAERLHQLGQVDGKWAEDVSLKVYDSPDGMLLVIMARDFDFTWLKEQTEAYATTTPHRTMLKLVSGLLGMDEASFLAEAEKVGAPEMWGRAKKVIQDGSSPLGLEARKLLETWKLSEKTVMDLLDVFTGKDAIPWSEGEWKAKLYDAWLEHEARWLVEHLGVEVEGTVGRMADVMKSIYSLALLDLSAKYAIANGLNNISTMVVDRNIDPSIMGRELKWLERFSVAPFRLAQSFGGAGGLLEGVDLGALHAGKKEALVAAGHAADVHAMEALTQAAKGGGGLATADRWIHNIRRKVGLASRLAGKMERASGIHATTAGIKQWWSGTWRRGAGYRIMPPELERLLGPDVASTVYGLVDGAMNQDELAASLMKRSSRRPPEAFLDDVAADLGMSPQAVREAVAKTGFLDYLNERLGSVNTREDLARIFTDWEAERHDYIQSLLPSDLDTIAGEAAAQAQAGDWMGVLDLYYGINRKVADWWTQHVLNMSDMMAKADEITDPAVRNAMISSQMQSAQAEWGRMRSLELAAYDGIEKGLRGSANDVEVRGPLYDADMQIRQRMQPGEAFHGERVTPEVRAQAERLAGTLETGDKLVDVRGNESRVEVQKNGTIWVYPLSETGEAQGATLIRHVDEWDTGGLSSLARSRIIKPARGGVEPPARWRELTIARNDIRERFFIERNRLWHDFHRTNFDSSKARFNRFVGILDELDQKYRNLTLEDVQAQQALDEAVVATISRNNPDAGDVAGVILAEMRDGLLKLYEREARVRKVPLELYTGERPTGKNVAAKLRTLFADDLELLMRMEPLLQSFELVRGELMVRQVARRIYDLYVKTIKLPAIADYYTLRNEAVADSFGPQIPRAERIVAPEVGSRADVTPRPETVARDVVEGEKPVEATSEPIRTVVSDELQGLLILANKRGRITIATPDGRPINAHLVNWINSDEGLGLRRQGAPIRKLEQLAPEQAQAATLRLEERGQYFDGLDAISKDRNITVETLRALDHWDDPRLGAGTVKARRLAVANGMDEGTAKMLPREQIKDWLLAKRDGRPYEGALPMSVERYRQEIAQVVGKDKEAAWWEIQRRLAASRGMTPEEYVAHYSANSGDNVHALHQAQNMEHPATIEAIEYFGVTDNPHEAGYLLPDGRFLDFSGRHWETPASDLGWTEKQKAEYAEMPTYIRQGDRWVPNKNAGARAERNYANTRNVDHSEPEGALKFLYDGHLQKYDWMAQAGVVRWSWVGQSLVIEIGQKPTRAQMRQIEYHAALASKSGTDVVVETWRGDWRNPEARVEYDKFAADYSWDELVQTIRNVYPDTLYQRPEVVMRDPAFAAAFEGSQAVDAEGRPQVLYHGSDMLGASTRFDPSSMTDDGRMGMGFEFTDDPALAGGEVRPITRELAFATEAEARAANKIGYPYYDAVTGKWRARVLDYELSKLGTAQRPVPKQIPMRERGRYIRALKDTPAYAGLVATDKARADKILRGFLMRGSWTALTGLEDMGIQVRRVLVSQKLAPAGGIIPAYLLAKKVAYFDRPVSAEDGARILDAARKLYRIPQDVTLEGRPLREGIADLERVAIYDGAAGPRPFDSRDVGPLLQTAGFDSASDAYTRPDGRTGRRWTVYDADRVRSIYNPTTATNMADRTLFQLPESANMLNRGFYLLSQRLIETKMTQAMPVDQFRRWLKGKGVKQEELYWTGLDEWLTKRSKKQGAVTPEELRRYYERNQFTIEEVHYPGLRVTSRRAGYSLGPWNETSDVLGRQWSATPLDESLPLMRIEEHPPGDGGWREGEVEQLLRRPPSETWDGQALYAIRELRPGFGWQTYAYAESLEKAKLMASGQLEIEPRSPNWESVQMGPGGADYHEIVLTWPRQVREIGDFFTWLGDKDAGWRLGEDSWLWRSASEEVRGRLREEYDAAVARGEAMTEVGPFVAGEEQHKWGENNVIAWIRGSEYTDLQGRRVFVIDEVQSDWHEKGRDRGYASEESRARLRELNKEVNRAEAALKEAQQDALNWSKDLDAERYVALWTFIKDKTGLELGVASAYEARNYADSWITEWTRHARQVANDPFYLEQLSPDARAGLDLLMDPAVQEIALRTTEAKERHQQAQDSYRVQGDEIKMQVPAGPWSDDYGELAFKRAAMWAVQKGYDVLAWTTGERQGERWMKHGYARHIGWVIDAETETITIYMSREGKPPARIYTHDEKELSTIVGKDLARRILAREGESPTRIRFETGPAVDEFGTPFTGYRVIDEATGQQIGPDFTNGEMANAYAIEQVGYIAGLQGWSPEENVAARGARAGVIRPGPGETKGVEWGSRGFHVFYDDKFGGYAKRFANTFGGKVGDQVVVVSPKLEYPMVTEKAGPYSDKWRVIYKDARTDFQMGLREVHFSTEEAARDYADRVRAGYQEFSAMVHAVELNEKARSSVLQNGMTLFQLDADHPLRFRLDRARAEIVQFLARHNVDADRATEIMRRAVAGEGLRHEDYALFLMDSGEWQALAEQLRMAELDVRLGDRLGHAPNLDEFRRYMAEQYGSDVLYQLEGPKPLLTGGGDDGIWRVTLDGREVLPFKDEATARRVVDGLNADGVTDMQRIKPKGAATPLQDGMWLVRYFDGADVSTVVHENLHVFSSLLKPDEVEIIKAWQKEAHGSDVDYVDGRFVGDDAEVGRAYEDLARGFERYMAEGVAPVPALAAIFERFKEWLLGVYRSITGSSIDVKITPEVRRMFDAWLTLPDEIERAQQEALPLTDRPADVMPTRTNRGVQLDELATEIDQAKALEESHSRPTPDRARVGGMTPDGRLLTQSGREIPLPDKRGKVETQVKKMHAWLVEQAKAEMAARKWPADELLKSFVESMNPKRLSQSDVDTLNDVLFGVEEVRLVWEDPTMDAQQKAKASPARMQELTDKGASKADAAKQASAEAKTPRKPGPKRIPRNLRAALGLALQEFEDAAGAHDQERMALAEAEVNRLEDLAGVKLTGDQEDALLRELDKAREAQGIAASGIPDNWKAILGWIDEAKSKLDELPQEADDTTRAALEGEIDQRLQALKAQPDLTYHEWSARRDAALYFLNGTVKDPHLLLQEVERTLGEWNRAAPKGMVTTLLLSSVADRINAGAQALIRGGQRMAGVEGAQTTAHGPDPNIVYQFRYQAVELADLIVSHDPRSLEPNPAYPSELQPRQRDREAAKQWVDGKVQTWRPQTLLELTARLDDGSPIIGPDMLVESGNGRLIVMSRLTQDEPTMVAQYKDELVANAGTYGLDPSTVGGMTNPMLVRVRLTELTPTERIDFTHIANAPTTAQMSAAEKARADAMSFNPDLLVNLEIGDTQTFEEAIAAPRNRKFVQMFLAGITEEERATFFDAGGELNIQGKRRILAAVLAQTFDGDKGARLAEILTESADVNVKNLGSGIIGGLGELARAESLIRSGRRPAELTIVEDLAAVTTKLSHLRQIGMSVDDYVAQTQMFERELTPFQEQMLGDMGEWKSARQARETIKAYGKLVAFQPDVTQGALFGDMQYPTKAELWDRALGSPQETLFQLPDGVDMGAPDSIPPEILPGELSREGVQNVAPVIQGLRDRMLGDKGYLQEQVMNLDGLPQDGQRMLTDWITGVKADMAQTKMGAIRWGETMRDMSLLNYNNRRGFSGAATLAMPYYFWPTETVLRWALRLMDRPAMLANFYRLRQKQKMMKEIPGWPTRLEHKIEVPVPFMPDWMGGGVFVDPLGAIFPPIMFQQGMERFTSGRQKDAMSALRVLGEWVEKGQVPEQEAKIAATQGGPIWDRAVAQAQAESDSGNMDPFDFISTFTGFAPPVEWARQYYRGTPENISPLPITRLIKTSTAALGLGGPGGVNIEAPIRRSLNLPTYDRFESYRVDRMLATLAAEGKISADEALMAGMERSGPAYDEALRRIEQVRMAGGFANPLFWIGFPGDIFPKGEEHQRALGLEWGKAYDAYANGDTEALDTFLDKYPEYRVRLASFDDPQERLKSYLVDEVWLRYRALDPTNKQLATQQLGTTFQLTFLDKETRNYADLDIQTLALWAKALGGIVPNTKETDFDLPMGMKPPEVRVLPPALAKEVNDYKEWRNKEHPYWFALQSRYYDLPAGPRRRQFLAQFPMLKKYWDENRAYLASHPDVKLYQQSFEVTNPEGEEVGRLSMPEILSNPMLMRQLYGATFAGQPLSSGALTELERIWQTSGQEQPFGSWLQSVMTPLAQPGQGELTPPQMGLY